MSVSEVVARREIEDVLHFTTNKGLAGILYDGNILSRQRLPDAKHVEHVYKPNAKVRRDLAWLDYVNLSISRLNWEYFGHSRRWHSDEDVWWCALVFSADLLLTPGALFTTTNNMYTGCARRADGDGLESLFAPRITRWAGAWTDRDVRSPESWTTCHQAEVLIPEAAPLQHLTRIIVATERHADIAWSQCDILLGDTPITVEPLAFEPQTIP